MAARGVRRSKKRPDQKTLLIVGGIAGGGVLLLVVVLIVIGASSSDPDGGRKSSRSESVNSPVTTDPQVAADREAMKRELRSQHSGGTLKIIEWGEPETTSYLVVFTAKSPYMGVAEGRVRSPEEVPALTREFEQDAGHSYDVAKVEPIRIKHPFVFQVTEDGERTVYDAEYHVDWKYEAAIERNVFKFEMGDRDVSLGSRIPRTPR